MTSDSNQVGIQLPWPQEFGPRRARWPFAVIAMSVVGLIYFLAVTGAGIAGPNGLRIGLGIAGATVSFAFLALSIVRLRVRRSTTAGRIHIEQSDSGERLTVVRMSNAMMVFGILVSVGGGVFIFLLALIRIGNGSGGAVLAIPLILIALACVACGALLGAMARLPRRIALSENGIHQNNGALHQFLPWDRLATIEPTFADPTGGRSRRQVPMVLLHPTVASDISVLWRFRWLRQRNFLDVIAVQPISYPVDGGLLYYTLRFYWQHPELRQELGSDAAIERMRRADVLG